jgi:hypothetical protein
MYWLIARYGIVAVLGLTIGWLVNGWRLNASISDLKASYAASEARVIQQYRDKEIRLQEASNALRKDKDAQIQSINTRLADAIGRLQQRESRGNSSDSARACSAANGSHLSREDAEFLTREAARADEAVTRLNACVQQYNKLR